MRKLDPADDTVRLTLRLPAGDLAWIDHMADKRGCSRSDVVRLMIAWAQKNEDLLFAEIAQKEEFLEAS